MPIGEKTILLWKNKEYRKYMTEKRKKGKDNPNWKGGEKINIQGYVLIYKPEHPFCNCDSYIRRSHFVMEQIIGRYLKPEEVVHHKGVHFPINSIENRQDDSPENLQLFSSNSKHSKFHHPKGYKNKGSFKKGQKGYWNGKKFSEDYKRKISISHKGKKLTEEHRKNISKSTKGRKKPRQKSKLIHNN